MVNAAKRGSKTQTRRLIKPQPDHCHKFGDGPLLPQIGDREIVCPYGKAGDRLYVKEATWMWCERRPGGTTRTGRPKWNYVPMEGIVRYVADRPDKPNFTVPSPDTGNQWGWRYKVARFMPRWASRITIEIVSIRAERLQAISEEDAIAEGVERNCDGDFAKCPGCHVGGVCRSAGEFIHYGRSDDDFPAASAVESYQSLWDSINAGSGHAWELNDWVWVVEFKVDEVKS
jgi:hypothetical protein